jgi:hypothetical protein
VSRCAAGLQRGTDGAAGIHNAANHLGVEVREDVLGVRLVVDVVVVPHRRVDVPDVVSAHIVVRAVGARAVDAGQVGLRGLPGP